MSPYMLQSFHWICFFHLSILTGLYLLRGYPQINCGVPKFLFLMSPALSESSSVVDGKDRDLECIEQKYKNTKP